jgi:hypothetical protein
MKYKTKIEPQNGGYIGYAILHDEVVYSTKVLRDPVVVSRDLANYINNTTPLPLVSPPQRPKSQEHRSPVTDNNLVPVKNTNTEPRPEPETHFKPMPPPRRCCGRG